MKTLITLLLAILLSATVAHAQVEITSTDNFNTRDQMLLANEINESGEPFAEALGYDLDLLDPMVLNDPDSISYTLGIENYEYSRYQLGTVISRSGIGLHMMWAPMIMQMAAMEPPGFDGSMTGTPNGFNEDDELVKNIMHFAMLSNGMAPMHPWPQFAEFENGDPHLPQAVADDFQMDFSSLRWDRSLMDKTFNLGAMGQTLRNNTFGPRICLVLFMMVMKRKLSQQVLIHPIQQAVRISTLITTFIMVATIPTDLLDKS